MLMSVKKWFRPNWAPSVTKYENVAALNLKLISKVNTWKMKEQVKIWVAKTKIWHMKSIMLVYILGLKKELVPRNEYIVTAYTIIVYVFIKQSKCWLQHGEK